MKTKALAKNFLERARKFLIELFSNSSSSSFFLPFLSGYYVYVGIALTIATNNALVFVVLALPAILGLVTILIDSCWLAAQ